MAEPEDEDGPPRADERGAGGPGTPPAGLSSPWPVDWQPVWGPANGPRAHVEHWLLQVCLAVAVRLPEAPLRGLIATLARLARRVDRRHSQAARVFLRQALGPLSDVEVERRVLQAYRHFFGVILDAERLPRRVPFGRVLEHFDVAWTDEARRVLDGGTGCVLVTAHVGNWEVGTAVAPWMGFDPLYAIAKPVKNRPMSRQLQRSREERGVRLLPRRGAMQDAPRVIRGGGYIAMLLDQRARKRPILAPFFGRPARCDRSAGVLLRRLGVPLVFFALTTTERPLHYRVEFFGVLWPGELAGLDPLAIATRVNGIFERMIAKYPDQYLWLHDRYRDTPLRFEEEESPLESAASAASNEASSSSEES